MENLSLFISLIEGTNDLIHSITRDGTFEFVNRSWLETLGYTGDEIKNVRLTDILFPGYQKKHQDLVDKVFAGKSVSDVDVTFLTKEGDTVIVHGSLFPHHDGKKITAVHGFFRNITEEKETEEKLLEARARTEFFVDLMVHDLTNIHQEILSTFEILTLTPGFPVQLLGFVNEGLEEIDRASHIVNNVRKLTQLYTMKHEEQIVDLAEAISTASMKVKGGFPEKELVITTSLQPGQYSIKADEFLIDVFYSLFHNSMRFSKEDRVLIDIDLELVRFTPFLRIEIKDHGPGIKDEDKDILFERLSHRRDSVMGLGLGLTLVRKIIENYGGYINIHDTIEGDHTKGANFTILLWYQKPEQNLTGEVS